MMITSSEEAEYTLFDLFSDVGGGLGIFLGLSLVSILQLFDETVRKLIYWANPFLAKVAICRKLFPGLDKYHRHRKSETADSMTYRNVVAVKTPLFTDYPPPYTN